MNFTKGLLGASAVVALLLLAGAYVMDLHQERNDLRQQLQVVTVERTDVQAKLEEAEQINRDFVRQISSNSPSLYLGQVQSWCSAGNCKNLSLFRQGSVNQVEFSSRGELVDFTIPSDLNSPGSSGRCLSFVAVANGTPTFGRVEQSTNGEPHVLRNVQVAVFRLAPNRAAC